MIRTPHLIGLFLVVLLVGGAWLVYDLAMQPAPPSVETETVRETARDTTIPEGAGVITGTVLRDSRPARATVEVTFLFARITDAWVEDWQAAREIRAIETGVDGTFRIEGLAPGRHRVSARSEDGASATTSVDVETGQPADVTLALVLGTHVLDGRVRHADGRPFTGAVHLVYEGDGWLLFSARITGAEPDGRFRFEALPAGRARLSVLVPRIRRVFGRPFDIPHEGGIEFIVDADLVEVAGRVVSAEDDAPVAGAALFLNVGEDVAAWVTATSAADGRFRILSPAGPGRLSVSREGYNVWQEPIEAPDDDVTVSLERPARLTGRVLSAKDGTPITGVSVLVSFLAGESPRPTCVSDEDGRYEFEGVHWGNWRVYARGEAWLSRELTARERMPEQSLRVFIPKSGVVTHDLTVVPTARVVGRVLDAAGNPAPDVAIEGRALGLGLHFDGRYELLPPVTTRTDVAGRFELVGLTPRVACGVLATPASGAAAFMGPVRMDPGGEKEIEIRLPADRRLDIRVVALGTERGIAGAEVEVLHVLADSTCIGICGKWTTDREGRVIAGPLPLGALSVAVSAPGYVDPKDDLRIDDPSGTTATVVLTPGHPLTGRVVFADGSPAARASIQVEFADGLSRIDDHAQANAAGLFRTDPFPAGRLTVVVTARRFSRPHRLETVIEDDRADVELVVEDELASRPDAYFVVRVRDPEGRPVPKARITYHCQGTLRSTSTTTSLESGKITFRREDIPEAQEWIVVHDARDDRGRSLPFGPARHGPFARTETEVEITLPPEVLVSGVVRRESGEPVPAVTVRLSAPEQNTLGWPPGRKAQTDDSGAFTIGGLLDAEYEMTLTAPRSFAPPPSRKVRAGTTGLVILLAGTVRPVIRVVDWKSEPVAGATVSVFPASSHPSPLDDPEHRGVTDASGRVRLEGLAPETTYTLTVRGPAGREDLLPRVLPEWMSEDTEIALERVFVLEGRVRGPDGSPVPHPRVQWRREEESHWRNLFRTRADGTFRIAGLRGGLVVVRAAARDADTPYDERARTTVSVAGGKVDLIVDPGLEIRVRIPGWPGGSDPKAYLTLAGSGRRIFRMIDTNGLVIYSGLRRGDAGSIFVGPVGGDHYVLVESLAAGGPTREAKLVRGGTIKGRLLLPEGATRGYVKAKLHGTTIGASAASNGTFVIRALPPGTWPLEASANLGGQRVKRAASAKVGTEIEIDFR